MLDKTESALIDLIQHTPELSSGELFSRLDTAVSYATLKRILSRLIDQKLLIRSGKGKASRYRISPCFELFLPIDIDRYYQKEIDERKIKEYFNFSLIPETLKEVEIFTKPELAYLEQLQRNYENNISRLSPVQYKKELERLAIDLSWKSAQIEGNTYSLLETERLLKEKETASGRTKEEAIMLLNHKSALDFVIENPDYLLPLSISGISDIHRLLMQDLGVFLNLRNRRVGISGTNYRPLDNEFQIKEALEQTCTLVNHRQNIFEKAFLVLVLISYIQPFEDGNKRTARILSNAILLHYNYCPVSFRTVDSVDYKKAMLLFYEQNNLNSFKKIFTDQFSFAVNTYF